MGLSSWISHCLYLSLRGEQAWWTLMTAKTKHTPQKTTHNKQKLPFPYLRIVSTADPFIFWTKKQPHPYWDYQRTSYNLGPNSTISISNNVYNPYHDFLFVLLLWLAWNVQHVYSSFFHINILNQWIILLTILTQYYTIHKILFFPICSIHSRSRGQKLNLKMLISGCFLIKLP